MAIETGIAPQHLLDLDSTMLENMLKVFSDRAKEVKSGGNRGKR